MLNGLEYVKETISLRENDITNNSFETNNLLLEDILLALGYNKRREPGVKALYTGGADWEISSNNEHRFIITVCGYGSTEIDQDKLNEAIQLADEQSYPIVIMTDGKWLKAYNTQSTELFSIDNIFDDTADEILNSLSCNTFDISKIYNFNKPKHLDVERIRAALLDENTVKKVLNDISEPDRYDDVLAIISQLVNINTNDSDDNPYRDNQNSSKQEDNTQNDELVTQIMSLNSQIDELNTQLQKSKDTVIEKDTQLSELSQQINQLTATVAEKDAQLSNLTSSSNDGIVSENENLKNELEQKNSDISRLNLQLAGSESKIASMNSKIESYTSECDKLKSDLESANGIIQSLKQQMESLSDTTNSVDTDVIEELNKQIKELNNEIGIYKSQINDINGQLSEGNTEIERLKSENESLKNAVNTDNSGKSETSNSSAYIEQINALQTTVDQLREENEKIKADKTDFSKGNTFETESAYRQRIAELIEDNQKKAAELGNIKEKLEELESKASGAEDEKIAMAKQLLEAVEDNPELRRTYVGVIESRLFQVIDLNKFVGISLQELFNVVEYDLMPILFDGDMFKIIQPAVRKDLLISTNAYDIDLSGMSELEIIGKLKKIFNLFPKVVFMCKMIGTVSEGDAIGLGAGTILNAPQFKSELTEDYSDEDFDEVIDLSPDQQYEAINNGEVNGFSSDAGEQGIQPVDSSIKLLGFALIDIQPVLDSPENPIINLEAMGNPKYCFKIKNQTYYDILNNGIISLICMTENALNGIDIIRNTDLQAIIQNVVYQPEQIEETFVQILGTEYYVDIQSVNQCVAIVNTIADILNIDKSQVYIYFSSEYNPSSSFVNNYLEANQINMNKYLNIEEFEKSKDTIHCLMDSNGIALVESVPGTYETALAMFTHLMAVKSDKKYQKMIKSFEDVTELIQEMLSYNTDIPLDEIINVINTYIPFEKGLISSNVDDMGESYGQFEVNGVTYYINCIGGFQTTLLIQYLHGMIFGFEDSYIDYRLEINSTLYNIYKNGVDISDCEEYLASKLILELIEGKTKLIVPKK